MSSQKNNNVRTVWFYVALAICVVAMAISVVVFIIVGEETNTLESPNNQAQNGGVSDDLTGDDQFNSGDIDDVIPNEPTISRITFIMPVSGEILNDYSDTPVFNATLNRYSSHMAMDFSATIPIIDKSPIAPNFLFAPAPG